MHRVSLFAVFLLLSTATSKRGRHGQRNKFLQARNKHRDDGDGDSEVIEDFPNFFSVKARGFTLPESYNRMRHPGTLAGSDKVKVTRVNVGIDVLQLNKIDAPAGVASLDVIIKSQWVDPRLAELPYTGYLEAHPDMGFPVWTPMLMVRNKAGPTEVLGRSLVLSKNGHLNQVERARIDVTINMDLWAWPYDVQVLKVVVSSFLYSIKDVRLVGYDPPGGFKVHKDIGWSIGGWKVVSAQNVSMFCDAGELDSFATGVLLLQRNMLAPTIQYIAPLLVISCFSMMALYISHEGGGFDTQLAVASFGFLAIMVYLCGLAGESKLPPVRYIMWIHWVEIFCFCVCFCVAAFLIKMHHTLVVVVEEQKATRLAAEQGTKLRQLDDDAESEGEHDTRNGKVVRMLRTARIVTPLVFIIGSLTLFWIVSAYRKETHAVNAFYMAVDTAIHRSLYSLNI